MTPNTLFESRYRIVRQLAEGGMGVVYEAEHQHTHRRVAIKCLHAEMTRNKEVVARFQREATAAAAIGNEHIIDVLDMARRDDGSFYMVLEFLQGRDLATALSEDGPFTVRRAIHVLSQVCVALEAAHHKGVVHRDLKPENLFLITRDSDPDYVKILDFGISKFRDADEGAAGPLTRTGSMMGTPHYMAPEQIQSTRDVDQRADIFALGVIAHELLSGTLPFDDPSIHLLIYRISALPPASLAEARPDLPPALVGLVERMLAKAPGDRFQDCAEVRGALAPFSRWEGDTLTSLIRPSHQPVAFEPTGISLASPPSVAVTPSRSSETSSIPEAPSFPIVTLLPSTSQPPSRVRWPIPTVLAIALLGTLVSWRLRTSDPAPRPPPSTVVRSAAAAIAPPAPTPAPVALPPAPLSPAPTARTHVQLGTSPDDAEVLLDGRRIANPFDGELPASTELHRLEVRHSGYTTVVQDLSLEFPQVIRVRLHHGRGVEDRRRNPAPNPATPAVEAPSQPAATHPPPGREPEPTPPPTATPPPPAVAPGVTLPPPQQPLRHIEL